MRRRTLLTFVLISTLSLVLPRSAWSQMSAVEVGAIREMRAGIAARMVGRLGQSGLRRFLASSTMLGEMLDRASSYRSVSQVEGARIAALDGLISGLSAALADPTLPPSEREAIELRRSQATDEREDAPEYRVSHGTGTADIGSLVYISSIGNRPFYIHGQASLHHREDREDRLTVNAPGGAFGVLFAPSDDWVLGIGASLSGHNAEVHTLEGTASGFGAGPRFDFGYIFHTNWALGLRGEYRWSDADVDILRGSPTGPVQVKYAQPERRTFLQAELTGTVSADDWGLLPPSVVLQPVLGLYHLTRHTDEVRDNLGNEVQGTAGSPEVVGLVRAVLSGSIALGSEGRWVPFAQAGYDYEFANNLDELLVEPHTVSASAGLTWIIQRTRRVSVSYTRHQGFTGVRTGTALTLVATLDY
jgi:hypothetical protein